MQHIVVIEDDKLLGKVLVDTLKEAGYEVSWGKNGAEGMAMIAAKKTDLVYLDIMLPGEDGYAILHKIKLDEATAGIPVVMLTNLGQTGEVEKAMELGATDYLIKANMNLSKLAELTRTKYLIAFS